MVGDRVMFSPGDRILFRPLGEPGLVGTVITDEEFDNSSEWEHPISTYREDLSPEEKEKEVCVCLDEASPNGHHRYWSPQLDRLTLLEPAWPIRHYPYMPPDIPYYGYRD